MADISLADIKKLRDMTSAGMMDCKKALTEAEGDFKRAVEILREKGKSTLAKRGDNETTQGAVLSRVKGGRAILVGLGCETDFVAATPDFKALAASIADAAIAEFPADLAALKAVKTATGYTLERTSPTRPARPVRSTFSLTTAPSRLHSCPSMSTSTASSAPSSPSTRKSLPTSPAVSPCRSLR